MLSPNSPKPRPPEKPLSAVPLERARNHGRRHVIVSRCTVPREHPLEWVFYRGSDGSVIEEIASHTHHLGQIDRELAIATIGETIEAAARGNLENGTDLLPISIDPEVWELRFQFPSGLFRLYYGEPFDHPSMLVALRFHQKLILGTDVETEDAQNGEIARAALRYVGGRASVWAND